MGLPPPSSDCPPLRRLEKSREPSALQVLDMCEFAVEQTKVAATPGQVSDVSRLSGAYSLALKLDARAGIGPTR